MRKGTFGVAVVGGVVVALGLTSAARAVTCAWDDVTLGGNSADACAGWTSGVGANTTDEGNYVAGSFTDGPWTFLAKDEGAPDSGMFAGLEFTLTANTGSETGSWTLSWIDPAPYETFPILLDFAVLMKSGQGAAAYLFEDFSIASAPGGSTGDWEIKWTNKNGHAQGLSHFSLFVREDGTPVPEPATMLLFGSGLVGLAGYARRRKK